ncbi:MAG TPA: glycosyltransferase family 39 protein [Stellaceae bacterium]|nr:glycosyltransferase family 39 protein [Stellaceae bacterium]
MAGEGARDIWIALLLALGALRIIATYPVYSHTYDEPAHLAAGMELLDRGTYTYEQLHPPLARVAVAIGPHLLGAHSHGKKNIYDEGVAILYAADDYSRSLTSARLGVLPFFLALIGLSWVWARREFGTVAAAVAVLLLVTTPTVLAHAGLATTDIALTATFMAALLCFVLWLEQPTASRSAALGVAAALAVTAKLSALAFLPVCFVTVLVLRWCCEDRSRAQLSATKPSLLALSLPVGAFALTIWIVYGCPGDPLLPFRHLWAGVQELLRNNTTGHESFFWGEVGGRGWWLFFPTALLVKTPLPFVILSGYGAVHLVRAHRRQWRWLVPLASAAAILLVAMPSPINLGVRYILPIYPMLAIVAGIGAAHLWVVRSSIARAGVVLLLTGQIAVSVLAHPDYLAYFNLLAGPRPEHLLVDSDLDWGQDVNRVATELHTRGIAQVAAALHGNADLRRHGFPSFTELQWHERVSGWIVISLTQLSFGTSAPPYDGFRWLQAFEPVATIGKTVRLYYIDAGAAAPKPR